MSTNVVEQLRMEIKERNLSHQEVADKCGVHYNTIRRYMSGDGGNLGLDTLERICNGLCVTLSINPIDSQAQASLAMYKIMYNELIQSLEAIEAITIKQLGVKNGL